MNLLKMTSSYLNYHQPSYMVLFVTSRCNANCGFCFYREEVQCVDRKKEELTLEEYRRISKKCGNVPYLLISGGEPVLRDDLFEIVSMFIENAQTRFVTIPSNGLSPARSEELFSRLTEAFPGCHFRASLSVDYSDERHDRTRGVRNCLNTVRETAERLGRLREKAHNLTLDVISIYLNDPAQNHHDLREWVRESLKPDNHELHILRPEWPEIVVEGLPKEDFLKELVTYREKSSNRENRCFSSFFRGLNMLYIRAMGTVMNGEVLAHCTAGRKFTVISETGSVRLCECRDEILGDLRKNDYDLKRILKRSRGYLKHVNRSSCTCTWESAISCNLVCNPKFIPALTWETVKMFLRARRRLNPFRGFLSGAENHRRKKDIPITERRLLRQIRGS